MKRIITSFSCSDHNVSLTKTPTLLKIIILSFISLFLFILVRRFSSDITPLVVPPTTPSQKFPMFFTPAVVAGKNPPPAPAELRHTVVERTGIIDENGAMTNDFIVGEFDEELIDSVVNNGKINGSDEGLVSDVNRGVLKGKIGKFRVCDESMRDYVPCLDNVEGKGETLKGKGLNCLVPRPKDYKLKIPWPKSRDEIWFSNVPRTPFAKDKAGYKWVKRKGDKYIFPGYGANQHSDQISKMVSEIAFGRRTRVAMDINCGIASFGTYLMDRNVSTLSIATKDVHSNQVQFALERGVPAMLAAFTTHRLLFPSQAFDLIHCSRCSINWTRDDGILLLEVNRMLRAGGYFILAAEPVAPFKEMEDLTQRLCWELLKKEGDISIWRKPLNNSCYLSRAPAVQPSLCDAGDDPDNVWNVNLKKCITQLPENGYGANMTAWPARLHSPPNRLFSIKMDAELSRREIFKAESKFWNDIIRGYIGVFRWKELNLRNVMDMRAVYGGFAAALHDFDLNCWVMNVVPVSGSNTLPVLYDRGLIGVMHDWCEPFDTYPRTYDLIHAAALLSVERNRCNVTTIMLEMDRILRPGGRVYIRDTTPVIEELQEIANALGWVPFKYDSSEGPHSNWKLLIGEKRL
ncbi:probable methyltransferase PMT10 [Lycium ferocissimum]|uniref:probable methyltransferase PMT10 n=1 Tax=Lycium ferocissimum TaxID=112874 RepID=UPI0028162FA4|nr:probable methyltransferase PMT10 [Lycium ferocissimum]